MADYCFFLSYARIDRDKDKEGSIRRFFDDLNDEVQRQGFADGGFFDTESTRDGQFWPDGLREGLASSRVLVPLYSFNYFRSPYCGREWEVFNRRYRSEKGRSEIILPIRFDAELKPPATVNELQIGSEYPPEYNTEGLFGLMRLKKWEDSYKEFIIQISRRLIKMARAQGEKAAFYAVPDLSTISSPFHENAGTGDAKYSPSPDRGSKFVKVILLAASPKEIQGAQEGEAHHQRSFIECYGSMPDRRDWRPSFPDVDEEAGILITKAALEENRYVDFLEPPAKAEDLLKAIRTAEKHNNVVCLVIDPWSIDVPSFRDFIEKFDEAVFTNCAILVHWNMNDGETVRSLPVLRPILQKRLKRQFEFTKTLVRNPITTPAEFRDALAEAFSKVRQRLIEEGNSLRSASSEDLVNETRPELKN